MSFFKTLVFYPRHFFPIHSSMDISKRNLNTSLNVEREYRFFLIKQHNGRISKKSKAVLAQIKAKRK